MEAGADLEQRADAARRRRRSPSVGSVIRASSFSSVDLPAPLRPMIADRLALGDVERHVAQRPHVLLPLALPRDALCARCEAGVATWPTR